MRWIPFAACVLVFGCGQRRGPPPVSSPPAPAARPSPDSAPAHDSLPPGARDLDAAAAREIQLAFNRDHGAARRKYATTRWRVRGKVERLGPPASVILGTPLGPAVVSLPQSALAGLEPGETYTVLATVEEVWLDHATRTNARFRRAEAAVDPPPTGPPAAP